VPAPGPKNPTNFTGFNMKIEGEFDRIPVELENDHPHAWTVWVLSDVLG
jgi:hypothetical protein